MLGKGWITGSDIISKPPTDAYREGWERIFSKKRNFDANPSNTQWDNVVDEVMKHGNIPTGRE